MNRQQSGFSLIELMVSMGIGLVLIAGALFVFDEARATLRVNETLARMQENARWAMEVLEPDIRMAGYWGRHTSGSAIAGHATSGNPLNVNVAGDCDTDWTINIATSLAGSNNIDPGLDCIAAGEYSNGTDTLQIRHASGTAMPAGALVAGRIYVRTNEAGEGSLFVGTAEPAIADGQNNALMAHAYYVRPYTIGAGGPPNAIPSLRRQGLTLVGGAPRMVDQEVIPGIEDLQVQFGIDTNGDGSVNRYVNPDNAVLNTNPKVLATRVWLLVRADTPEAGFTDTRTYVYGDQSFTPVGPDASFRRLLVSRTVFLRNEAIIEGGIAGL